MKFTIELDPMKDADAVGELLREMFFVKKREYDFGCYSTFEVDGLAQRLTDSEREDFWRREANGGSISTMGMPDYEAIEWEVREYLKMGEGWRLNMLVPSEHSYPLISRRIDAHWFWDGDGTLCFVLYEQREPRYVLTNTDCKKSYGWKCEEWK